MDISILKSIANSRNPMEAISQMMNSNPQMKNNPLLSNAMNMAKNGNTQGLENMARNLAQQQGIDINQLINMFKAR